MKRSLIVAVGIALLIAAVFAAIGVLVRCNQPDPVTPEPVPPTATHTPTLEPLTHYHGAVHTDTPTPRPPTATVKVITATPSPTLPPTATSAPPTATLEPTHAPTATGIPNALPVTGGGKPDP